MYLPHFNWIEYFLFLSHFSQYPICASSRSFIVFCNVQDFIPYSKCMTHYSRDEETWWETRIARNNVVQEVLRFGRQRKIQWYNYVKRTKKNVYHVSFWKENQLVLYQHEDHLPGEEHPREYCRGVFRIRRISEKYKKKICIISFLTNINGTSCINGYQSNSLYNLIINFYQNIQIDSDI